MKIIKENLKESMSPNEKMFMLLGKGEADKATNMIDKQALLTLRKVFPSMSDSDIKEEDGFFDLATQYEKAYIDGISEMLHNPLEIYV